jgi:hypothetical protein
LSNRAGNRSKSRRGQEEHSYHIGCLVLSRSPQATPFGAPDESYFTATNAYNSVSLWPEDFDTFKHDSL